MSETMRRFGCAVSVVIAVALVADPAAAQQPLPPLPVVVAPADEPPPPPPPPPSPAPPPPPTVYIVGAPPGAPVVVTAVRPPKHAPMFSLWAGGRLGVLGFGGFFYNNELGQGETTGNFITAGLSVEVDVGVRLGRRYLPYLFWEHGFVGAGHRFAGESASASTDFRGLGFRYSLGDVDSVSFLSDLAIGLRTVSVTAGGSTYSMSALEIFRFGLGAEIRFSTLFTISPLAWVSGGAMSDTSGSVTYGPGGSGDGLTSPTYKNGESINDQRTYLAIGIGCGAHFDFFGK